MKISVLFEALTGTFNTDIDRSARNAEKRVKQMESTMRGSFGKLSNELKGFASAFSLFALDRATRAAIAHADAIGDTAKRLGLTTKAYQELSYAAKQLEVDQGDLDSAMGRFIKTLGQARLGDKGALEAFGRLGLDPRKFKDTDQAFAEVSKRLGEMGNQFERTALLATFFGKESGPKLAEFVSTSAKEVSKLRSEAQALGVVLSQDTIDKADKAQKQFDAMSMVIKTQLTVALVDLKDPIVGIAEAFTLMARGIAAGVKWLKDFADGISETLAFGIQVDEEIRRRQQKRAMEEKARQAAPGLSFPGLDPRFSGAGVTGGRVTMGGGGGGFGLGVSEEELDRQEEVLERYEKYVKESDERVQESKEQALKARLETLRAEDEALERSTRLAEKSFDQMTVFAEEAGRNMQDVFAEFLFDPFEGGLKGMVDGFAETLRKMAAQAVSAQILGGIGEWGAANKGEGLLGWIASAAASIFPKKADGGDVSSGRAYLVGERAPEIFVPRTSGTIVPLDRAGGIGVTQVFNISTPDANSFRASERQIMRRSRQRLQS